MLLLGRTPPNKRETKRRAADRNEKDAAQKPLQEGASFPKRFALDAFVHVEAAPPPHLMFEVSQPEGAGEAQTVAPPQSTPPGKGRVRLGAVTEWVQIFNLTSCINYAASLATGCCAGTGKPPPPLRSRFLCDCES